MLENDLAPREVMRCGGIHVVTADDIDSRETVSTTSVKAVDKVGREVADSETTSVSLDQVRQNWVSGLQTYIIPYYGLQHAVFE